MKKFAPLFVLVALSAGLAACGQKAEPVSFQTLEDARATANENAAFNAQRFVATNPIYQSFKLISHGDSTQSNECPQGDGWATQELLSPDMKQTVKLKCSTVSASLGCLLDGEFKTKSYNGDDGVCQPVEKVPMNKKIAK